MSRKIFIIPSSTGWEVKLEGMTECLSRHTSQAEATEAARRYAGFYHAEIRILSREDPKTPRQTN